MRKGNVKDRVNWGGSVVVVEEEEEAITFMDQEDGLAQMEVCIIIFSFAVVTTRIVIIGGIVITRISLVYIKP